jgi:hypothetical protein
VCEFAGLAGERDERCGGKKLKARNTPNTRKPLRLRASALAGELKWYALPTRELRAGVVRADWEISVTCAAVSPGSAGLRRGVCGAPGFRHAEGFGDTRMLSCVIWSRIENYRRMVNCFLNKFF